jgi:ATP-dependent RNA helicase DDX41
MSIGEWPSISL